MTPESQRPGVEPSTRASAVFLSYAREDAAAARRIADALRAFGIEVWFDQNELRGGDAWDQKLRKQIRECALFVPIVSTTTQQRGEGYFRREWKQGVERTHDMAASRAFLLPVVIDATLESDADVPEEFMRVQWTRLVNGVPTPDFLAHVKHLLETPRASPARGGSREAFAAGGDPAVPAPAGAPPPSHHLSPGEKLKRSIGQRMPRWLRVVVSLIAVALALYFSRKTDVPAAAPGAVAAVHSEPPAPNPPPLDSASAKSIAVLPFENISADKANSYFCDGVQEDILTSLANIGALRVVSRTSVEKYRGTTKSVPEIAQELGVAYILEGSVQRDGNRVRVTGQLIRAAADEHVWAQAYTRDLTDVFSIQSELAQAIAAALQTAISPEEKSRLDHKPTNNATAYDLFLKARDIPKRSVPSPASIDRRVALLESAVELDPTFASAWGELADAHAFAAFSGYEGSLARLGKAKEAIDRAVRLAPEDPTVIQDLGTYYYYGYRDYARAAEQYNKLARIRPNDASVFNSLALIERRQGQWPKSLGNSQRAVELEPANAGYLRNLVATLEAGNRWDEMIAAQQRLVDLQPDDLEERFNLAEDYFEARESKREAEAFFARLTPAQADSPLGLWLREQWALAIGDNAAAIRLDQRQPYYDGHGVPHYQQALFIAIVLAATGDHVAAGRRLEGFPEELRAWVQTEPENSTYWLYLGTMEAILGQKEAAIRDIEHGCAILPIARDALDGVNFASVAAAARGWQGDADGALTALPQLVRTPGGPKISTLRYSAIWAQLRDDVRFQALLSDPKNNAPLF